MASLNEDPGRHDHSVCMQTPHRFFYLVNVIRRPTRTTNWITSITNSPCYLCTYNAQGHALPGDIVDLSGEVYRGSMQFMFQRYTHYVAYFSATFPVCLWCVSPCPQVTILHPGGVSLEWTQCADLPVGMYDVQAVQLRTKVYVQGFTDSLLDYNIYTYEVPTGVWVSMKSPTGRSALTIYRSQLVLVGGKEPTTRRTTNQLWVLPDEQTWTQPLPPMPTARDSASAISSGDHLVVAGGEDQGFSELNLVEVYDGLQWMRADPLPVACSGIQSTYHSGMWYLVGGIGQSASVFYTSLHALIEKATQQPPHSPHSEQQSVWKTLPGVPYECSSTTTLGGALLAVGGMDSKGEETSPVHMYSPLTRSWLHVGDMPEAGDSTCSITLTTGEVMVIGGWTESGKSPHVHKVCLKLQ